MFLSQCALRIKKNVIFIFVCDIYECSKLQIEKGRRQWIRLLDCMFAENSYMNLKLAMADVQMCFYKKNRFPLSFDFNKL